METPLSALPLRTLAQSHGKLIGAAVDAGALAREATYREVLGREFNVVTPENAMKFGPLHPERDRYDFRQTDAIVDFAEAHGMQVRGHTLIWHNQLPRWLTEGQFNRDELIAILREHIQTVVGRYRGRVAAWDVVNEAVADDGSLRDTLWLRGIGTEYIELAFRWAHEADPDARLFYNDYGGEGLGLKSDAIYTLLEGLRERGVPVHGVGLQMHVGLRIHPSERDVAANIRRLGGLGLSVHITEMDVRILGPATQARLAGQAGIYRAMLEVCLADDQCEALVFWGFTDRHSWIPSFFPGSGTALIFDQDYRPKPAYEALREALAGGH